VRRFHSYKIYNANLILEVPAVRIRRKFNDLTASWIEVVAGIKGI
jgi:GTPase SAR1 family protein